MGPLYSLVLNARGHRSGDDFEEWKGDRKLSECSTPEGIEAATTICLRVDDDGSLMCSTPEGIEAATTLPSP